MRKEHAVAMAAVPSSSPTSSAPSRRISSSRSSTVSAARASVLARSWRGLWRRLADLTFRDVPPVKLREALDSLLLLLRVPSTSLVLLDVRLPDPDPEAFPASPRDAYAATVSSLLQASAGLAPADLRFALPTNRRLVTVDLPCFRRAAAIDLRGPLNLVFTRAPPASFRALRSASLSGCRVSVDDLLLRCPHLRLLWATGHLTGAVHVRSASLQELVLDRHGTGTACIDVDAPILKQLTMTFETIHELRLSILAPMMEKVEWTCAYPACWDWSLGPLTWR